MLNAHIYYGLDVIVVERIENRLALLAVFDKPRVFQHAKLMGDRRHAHTKLFGDVANAHLSLEKKIKDLDARAIAHYREKFGKIEEMLVVGQLYFVDDLVMRLVCVTYRQGFDIT